MRDAGYSLAEHPYEKFVQGRGKYKPSFTTEGFLEGAAIMMSTMPQYLRRRDWSVLVSERLGESLVVSDHPVVLEWSDPRGHKCPPGHAHVNTELTFPLSSHVALTLCDPRGLPKSRRIPVRNTCASQGRLGDDRCQHTNLVTECQDLQLETRTSVAFLME
jgi:hypothetical protein